MSAIEVFGDIVCPFTYVGLRRFFAERSKAGSTRRLRVRAWPLEWVNGRPLAPAHVAHEIEALRASVAPGLFRGFDASTFPDTSIPALGLAAAAYAVDDVAGEAVSLAIREALFERGVDISDDAALREIAHEHQIEMPSPSEAEAAVRADFEAGKQRGVKGSPHFFDRDHDWFCPTLLIESEGEHFDVYLRPEANDFFTMVLR